MQREPQRARVRSDIHKDPLMLQNVPTFNCKQYFLLFLCLSDERVDPAEMKSYEWILPETMANFVQLPLQYRGMCGYTLVEKNGLLLPGLKFFFLHFYTLITL